MKTKARVFISFIFLVLVIMFYFIVRYDLHVLDEKSYLKELTIEEKLEDFNYLLHLAKDVYPFAKSISEEKGLEDFYSMEQVYLERIKKTTNNKEFVKVIGEMVQHLEHGTAHCDILAPSKSTEWEKMQQALIYNVSKKGLQLRRYWWRLLEKNSTYAHAGLATEYRDGNYVVTDTFEINRQRILPGSVIKKIDDIPVDAYVKTLFNKIWLRFDGKRKKVYCHHSPFLAVQDTLKKSWKTELIMPDGSIVLIDLPVKKGYKPPKGMSYPKENVTCLNLPNRTAYIKVAGFAIGKQREQDLIKIDGFFKAAKQPYAKLIIDLRNNLGGAPAYWQKAFVERFIKKTIVHEQYTVVTKDAFDNLDFNRKLFDWKYSKEVKLGTLELKDFSKWESNAFPIYLEEDSHYLFLSRKTYKPNKPYEFNGKVFLLIDHDSFSATEDFAKFAKETGFATIVGAQSIGGAAVAFALWYFELPNSHIMLSMEIDMAFNADGTLNEIFGTKPDFILEPDGYPTVMPDEYTKEALLNDKWVQFVLGE